MDAKPSPYQWATQKRNKDCEVIHCRERDPYKDFIRDVTGYYILLKVNFDSLKIEAAICDKEHRIETIFIGRNAQDIYHAIFDYEKKNKKQWFKEKTHIAYLGKELKKAELALVIGHNAYYQE